jgi:hypothetical protein
MAQPLEALAGTFWADINPDPVFRTLISAQKQIEAQTELDRQLLAACTGRETTPIFRRVLLQPWLIQSQARIDKRTWSAPSKVVRVPAITDRLKHPNRVWLDKMDFYAENGQICFREDPFASNSEQAPVFDADGLIIDAALTLWLCNADYDEGYLSNMWGAAVGLTAPSSEEYRDLLCAVYSALIGGTSRRHVEQVVSILNGGTYAREDETVVESGRDSQGLFLATDKNIYRPAKNGLPVVEVGARLKAGDPIFNTVTFRRHANDLQQLTVPKNFLDVSIGGDLTFRNCEVPLIHSTRHVEFEVGGHPEAIKRFWNLFNARKTEDGRHLCDLLSGETTINPLRFIVQNVLQYNCLLCIIRSPETPSTLSAIDQNRLLRQIVPPHEALLIARQ